MSTFRVPPREHFTLLSNTAARDPKTSYKAKGILGTMLSFDPNWVFRTRHLLTLSTNGKASLRTGIHELVKAGYVVKNEQLRGDRGRWANTDYDVYDYPQRRPLPQATADPESNREQGAEGEGGRNYRLLVDNRYVKVRNAAMRDPATSFKAKGILLTMLSFPPDWEFSEEYLENFATDRVDAISTGLDELIAAGYILRLEQQRKPNGHFGSSTYLVADYRIGTDEDPSRDLTELAITAPGKSDHGEAAPGFSAHGEPAPGKSVHGEPAPGKSAPKKNVSKKTVEKKTDPKKSSSAHPQAEPKATTQEGAKRGLDKKITATFKALLPQLFTDDPRRIKAWNGLTIDRQEEAFRRAQERKKNEYEHKAFSTVLKEELDIASGLARPAAQETTDRDPEAVADMAARRRAAEQAAEQRFNEVYDDAIAEGATVEEATRRAGRESDLLRRQLLERPSNDDAASPTYEAAD